MAKKPENGKPGSGIDPHPRIQVGSTKRLLEKTGEWFKKGINLNARQRSIVQKDLESGVDFHPPFAIQSILSGAVATFGLINGSAAVVIGAMLIAPFLGPILGGAMAYSSGKMNEVFRAGLTIVYGLLIALTLSSIIGFLFLRLPYGGDVAFSSEVLSRVSPSVSDLMVALFGGSAAAFAVAHKHFASALSGAAIATALVPPVCTAGIGIAFMNPGIMLGAGLLFVINLTGIFIAAVLTFSLLGFKRQERSKQPS